MGHIAYGAEEFEFSDLVLSHIQMVVGTKLRRNEHFMLSWAIPAQLGSGRHSIWIDNGVALRFVYRANTVGPLDMTWLEAVIASASTPAGMHIPSHEPFSEQTAQASA